MKPPIEYRQRRPASSSGRTPDFGSGKPGSNPGAGTIPIEPVTYQGQKLVYDIPGETDGGSNAFLASYEREILKHKRAIKAAQMRRYRARKKGK